MQVPSVTSRPGPLRTPGLEGPNIDRPDQCLKRRSDPDSGGRLGVRMCARCRNQTVEAQLTDLSVRNRSP